ncbi:MAG: dockerin type I domain-containing protein [Candidatus Aenigmatarchaeota archaeon]
MGLTPLSYSIIFACIVIVGVFAISSVYESPAGQFRVPLVAPLMTEPAEVSVPLETETNIIEFTGTIETIIVDDFENNRAEYTYYMRTDDGKRYELEFEDNFLRVYVGEVSVLGIIEGDKFIVDSIETTGDKNAGDLEPWPPTLGEQKYAVVFFFRENETQFDFMTYTNYTFNLTNAFINESSYGKAGVSSGYVGNFSFNESLCFEGDIYTDAIRKIDPFINFTEYDGLIVFHPNTSCSWYPGLASLGKLDAFTDEGNVKLYQIWFNTFFHENPHFGILAHEMGHNFGLGHASVLICGGSETQQLFGGELENESTLGHKCTYREYGDFYDVMGEANPFKTFGLGFRLVNLGWIADANVPEVTEGTYFISPINTLATGNEIKGLKIPINWSENNITFKAGEGSPEVNLFDVFGMNYYFLEYKTNTGFDSIKTQENGVLIKLGKGDNYLHDENGTNVGYWLGNSVLLNLHPGNSTLGDCSQGCYDYGYVYLEEGQTYIDEFNNMEIRVLQTNDNWALVAISLIIPRSVCYDPGTDTEVQFGECFSDDRYEDYSLCGYDYNGNIGFVSDQCNTCGCPKEKVCVEEYGYCIERFGKGRFFNLTVGLTNGSVIETPERTATILVTDEESINNAIAWVGDYGLCGGEGGGRVFRNNANFNSPWSWHVKPSSIIIKDDISDFCDVMPGETCDGRPIDIEENLDYWIDVWGGGWCPFLPYISSIGNEVNVCELYNVDCGCGDVDASGFIDALDLGYLIDYLFAGGAEPIPVESGDINGDGQIDALDLGWLIDILFAGAENPNDCGNVDMSGVPTPNPTQSEKQQAQQILDDAGINIQI